MNLLTARRDVGTRVWFTVTRNGIVRTGLLAGDFTIQIVNPDDDASITPAVSESSEAGGLYYFEVPDTFLQAHGAGVYPGLLKVNATGPKIDDAKTVRMEVVVDDMDSFLVKNFTC